MYFIIFGPPGSGKGTYSRRLQERLGIPAISTGDIFRKIRNSKNNLGKNVKRYMDKGELVPDQIVNEVFKERIIESDCNNGFILDGYPRTVNQAIFLEKITKIDAILNLIIPDEILIEKLSARRICRSCGDIYNVIKIEKKLDGIFYLLPSMPPKYTGKCDKCGCELYQRTDDERKIIRERLDVYKKLSEPVLDFFKKGEGKIKTVDIHVTNGPEIMVDKIIKKLKKQNLI